MIIQNPGNVLPAYNNTRWQRHRQIGQDILPFGLPAPNMRGIPFQFYVSAGTPPEGITWHLVNAADESETYTQNPDLLTITEAAAGGYWITWHGNENFTNVPPCGFYYYVLGIGEAEYYFEVMNLKPNGGFEETAVIIAGCNTDGGFLNLEVENVDSLAAYPFVSATLEYFNEADEWVDEGPTGGVIQYNGDSPLLIRRTVVTQAGNTITANYTYTFSPGDLCGGELALTSLVYGDNTTAKPFWVMRFYNETDKGTVLYQTGYIQSLYVNPPVFNRPLIDRRTERRENGFGNEVYRYTRTAEKMRFEVADLPDYVIEFLSKAGDLSNVVLEDRTTGEGYALTNLVFTSRPQGLGLNVGEFQADHRTEVFSGCQENFVLA
jgi:hypothetical protein